MDQPVSGFSPVHFVLMFTLMYILSCPLTVSGYGQLTNSVLRNLSSKQQLNSCFDVALIKAQIGFGSPLSD